MYISFFFWSNIARRGVHTEKALVLVWNIGGSSSHCFTRKKRGLVFIGSVRFKTRFLTSLPLSPYKGTALIAEKKRQLHGDPSQHLISEKRKRKLSLSLSLSLFSLQILTHPNPNPSRFHFSGPKGRLTEWFGNHGRCSNGSCWRYLQILYVKCFMDLLNLTLFDFASRGYQRYP